MVAELQLRTSLMFSHCLGSSGGAAEGHIRELELGLFKGLALALLLPIIDNLGGFIQDLDPFVISDPALAFQL